MKQLHSCGLQQEQVSHTMPACQENIMLDVQQMSDLSIYIERVQPHVLAVYGQWSLSSSNRFFAMRAADIHAAHPRPGKQHKAISFSLCLNDVCLNYLCT